MGLYLSNFGRRVADYAYQNRARLIRALLVATAALILVALIFIGVGRIKEWQHRRTVQALETQRAEAESRAREAEARAAEYEREIEAREAELRNLETQAETLDSALKAARGRTITLKEAYETIRYVNLPADVPVSVAGACRELAAIQYPCK